MFLWWIPWLLHWWTLTLCTLTLLKSLEGLKHFSSLSFCQGILADDIFPATLTRKTYHEHLALFRRSVDEYDTIAISDHNTLSKSRLKSSGETLSSSLSMRSLESTFDDVLEGMGGSAIQKLGAPNVQRFATQPAPQTAVIGSTAVLPCRVMSKAGHLQWTKDGFGLGTDRGLFGFSRYKMIGSDDEGDFSLKIHPVKLGDDAIFQCQVSASNKVPAIQSRPVRLTVYVPPDPPQVEPSVLQTTAGLSVVLECKSIGGRPAPDIQWVDDSKRETIQMGSSETKELMDDRLRTIVLSRLTFVPSRHHDNQTITCSTSNQALSSPLTNSVRLKVHFPPEVELTSSPRQFVEGEDATFHCDSQANPSRVTYRWFLNTQEVANASSKSFILHNIHRKYHQRSVSCEVANKVGASKKTQSIFVRFGPYFQSDPKDIMAELGAQVDLRCNVSSNPHPNIVWQRGGSEKTIGIGSVFRVKVTQSTAGTYKCIASIPGRDYDFPTLEGEVKVLVKGPPLILSNSEQQGRMGDTVSLECNTVSIPKPMKITWTYRGREIDVAGDPRYDVLEDQQEKGLKNILVIYHSDSKDFGDYNCSVVNEYGIARKLIRLKEEKRVPILLVVGCAVGVVIVAVIAVSLVFCNKKNSAAKAQPPPEKTPPTGETGRQTLANMYSAASETKLDDEDVTCASSFQRPFGEVRVSPAPSPRMFPEIIRENLQRDNRQGYAFALKNFSDNMPSAAEKHEKALENVYPDFLEHPIHAGLKEQPTPNGAFAAGSRRASLTDVSIYSPTQRIGSLGVTAATAAPEFCTIRRSIRNHDPTRSNSPPVTYHNGIVGLGVNNHGRPLNGSVGQAVNRHSAYLSSPPSTAYSPPPPPPPYPRNSPKLIEGMGSPKAIPRPSFDSQLGSTSNQEAKYIFSPEAMLKPGTLV